MFNLKENDYLWFFAGFLAVISFSFFMYEKGKFNKVTKAKNVDEFDTDKNNLQSDLSILSIDLKRAKTDFIKNAA